MTQFATLPSVSGPPGRESKPSSADTQQWHCQQNQLVKKCIILMLNHDVLEYDGEVMVYSLLVFHTRGLIFLSMRHDQVPLRFNSVNIHGWLGLAKHELLSWFMWFQLQDFCPSAQFDSPGLLLVQVPHPLHLGFCQACRGVKPSLFCWSCSHIPQLSRILSVQKPATSNAMWNVNNYLYQNSHCLTEVLRLSLGSMNSYAASKCSHCM